MVTDWRVILNKIKTFKGNLLDVERGLCLHQANALGIFGAGIALQIKERYPEAYKAYTNPSKNYGLRLGTITYAKVAEDKYIVNLVGQASVGRGRQTSYDAIHDGFLRVLDLHDELQIPNLPICFPLIGSGLGGGDFRIISNIIECLTPEDIELKLYVLE